MVELEDITTTLCNHSSNVRPDLRTRLTHFVQIPTGHAPRRREPPTGTRDVPAFSIEDNPL